MSQMSISVTNGYKKLWTSIIDDLRKVSWRSSCSRVLHFICPAPSTTSTSYENLSISINLLFVSFNVLWLKKARMPQLQTHVFWLLLTRVPGNVLLNKGIPLQGETSGCIWSCLKTTLWLPQSINTPRLSTAEFQDPCSHSIPSSPAPS